MQLQLKGLAGCACQVLVVMLTDANACLNAAELLVAAFQSYHTLRQPIMEEIISGVLPNVEPGLRSFPVGDYHVHMVSALLLQMLQVGMFGQAAQRRLCFCMNGHQPMCSDVCVVSLQMHGTMAAEILCCCSPALCHLPGSCLATYAVTSQALAD